MRRIFVRACPKPQAANRHRPADQARRADCRSIKEPPEGNPQRLRRWSQAAARHVLLCLRSSSRTTRCDAGTSWRCATASKFRPHSFLPTVLGVMYRSSSSRIGPHDAQHSRVAPLQHFLGACTIRTQRTSFEEHVTRTYADRDGRAGTESGVPVGSEGADHPHGVAEEGGIADLVSEFDTPTVAAAECPRRRAAAGFATRTPSIRRLSDDHQRGSRELVSGLDMDSDLRKSTTQKNKITSTLNTSPIYSFDPPMIFHFDLRHH